MEALPVTRSGDLAGDPRRAHFQNASCSSSRWVGRGRGRGEGSARDWRSHSPRSGAASALRVGGEGRRHRRRPTPARRWGGAEGSVDRAEPAVPNRARPGWA
jgi:hypothetical protein